MHGIENTWHKIEFCEVERGIHGATPVETLHAIQHGLHEYLIASFFDQRKEKKHKKRKIEKIENTSVDQDEFELQEDEMDDEDFYFDSDLLQLKGNKVFPDHYIEKFNSLCQRYGKFIS